MYKITKLANQLEIISAPIAGVKTVTALVMVATGSKFENKQASGISHFLEHMFFKGTAKRPTTLAISSELDKVGGEFNAFTGKEYTGYYVKVAAGELALALDVLSDMLLNSKFASVEINREKGVIIEELNMYLDNPLIHIEDLFEACLYGDSPAGRDTIGTKKSILSFNRRDVLAYVRSQYSADKMIVCLAGRAGDKEAALAKKYFSEFSKKAYREKLKVKEAQTKPGLKLYYKKTDQAHLSLGVRTLPHAHPDNPIVEIIALILGGSMSSRLFTELRERRGLAYYVRTHDEPYTDSGYLTTQAGVPIDKLSEAIKIILTGYKELLNQPVKAEELNRVKQCLIGRSALQLESSDAVANWYARQAILFKEQGRSEGILTPEKYYARIKKVTIADISRIAKKVFVSHNLNLAVIGPYRDKVKLEKILAL
ncbi:MAG: pitrilysin family protein [bacterium]|nr:pitrilysin family protein [bacterium]